jgi:hypothetical protein
VVFDRTAHHLFEAVETLGAVEKVQDRASSNGVDAGGDIEQNEVGKSLGALLGDQQADEPAEGHADQNHGPEIERVEHRHDVSGVFDHARRARHGGVGVAVVR